MVALIVLVASLVAASLAALLREAPERRLARHPRGWWPGSRGR